MWKVTVKGLLAHKLRLALTALAIVLGVTFISGTLVLTDTLHNTFNTLFGHIYQNVDFEVRGKAGLLADSGERRGRAQGRSPSRSWARCAASPASPTPPGRSAATPSSWLRTARPSAPVGRPPSASPTTPTRSSRRSTCRRGPHPPRRPTSSWTRGRHSKYHFAVGQHVRMLLSGPPQTFTITGIVKFGTADNLAGATLAAFDLPDGAAAVRGDRQVQRHRRVGQAGRGQGRRCSGPSPRCFPPASRSSPARRWPTSRSSDINQALSFFSTALLVFAFISLFVGGFTIFNTFSIIVGQRTRELALLRIVGASRRQVFRSVHRGGGHRSGCVASLVGLGLGVLAAVGLEALLKGFGITLPTGPLVFEARTVVAALVVGVGVTVVSAISPARRAVHIPPVAALADYRSDQRESSRRRIISRERDRRPRGRGPARSD